MKKILAILLTLSFLFAFAACGSKSGTDGEKVIAGTWQLFDEGASAPKATLIFNEDMTGQKTTVRSAREETLSFTYSLDGAQLHIAYENGTVQDMTYVLEGDKLTLDGTAVYTRAAQ